MKDNNIQDAQTPIRDGDTRPDQNIDGKKRKEAGAPMQSGKPKITKERAADINSLEDFKDAKEN